jgi:hypothetical protein
MPVPGSRALLNGEAMAGKLFVCDCSKSIFTAKLLVFLDKLPDWCDTVFCIHLKPIESSAIFSWFEG